MCSVPAKGAVCSPDGTKLAAVTEAGVDIINLSNGAKVNSMQFYTLAMQPQRMQPGTGSFQGTHEKDLLQLSCKP
jgi:hypothetical protein